MIEVVSRSHYLENTKNSNFLTIYIGDLVNESLNNLLGRLNYSYLYHQDIGYFIYLKSYKRIIVTKPIDLETITRIFKEDRVDIQSSWKLYKNEDQTINKHYTLNLLKRYRPIHLFYKGDNGSAINLTLENKVTGDLIKFTVRMYDNSNLVGFEELLQIPIDLTVIISKLNIIETVMGYLNESSSNSLLMNEKKNRKIRNS